MALPCSNFQNFSLDNNQEIHGQQRHGGGLLGALLMRILGNKVRGVKIFVRLRHGLYFSDEFFIYGILKFQKGIFILLIDYQDHRRRKIEGYENSLFPLFCPRQGPLSCAK